MCKQYVNNFNSKFSSMLHKDVIENNSTIYLQPLLKFIVPQTDIQMVFCFSAFWGLIFPILRNEISTLYGWIVLHLQFSVKTKRTHFHCSCKWYPQEGHKAKKNTNLMRRKAWLWIWLSYICFCLVRVSVGLSYDYQLVYFFPHHIT